MEVYSVLVTGANRGIGLEFVRQLVRLPKPPAFVFATYRSSDSLGDLTEIKSSSKESQVVLIKMDVSKHEEIVLARKTVEQAVGEKGLTLLINNAGIAKMQEFPKLTEESLLQHFTVNTVGPIMILQEFHPLLQKAAAHNASLGGMCASRAAVLNISAAIGSVTNASVVISKDFSVPAYRVSKAGLNIAMRTIGSNVKEEGILIVLMCPGWVKTDMGTDYADVTAEGSISAMLKTLEGLNESHHGSFMDRFGELYPF